MAAEDVFTRLIDHRKMRMQPVAAFIGKRFGHEGCGHAVVACGAFDQFFEQNDIICYVKCRAMGHRDFKLPNAGFCGDGQITYPHELCPFGHIVEEVIEPIQFPQGQNFGSTQPAAGFGIHRWRKIATIFEQEKFQFTGGNHLPAMMGITVQNIAQGNARVAFKGGAVFIVHHP